MLADSSTNLIVIAINNDDLVTYYWDVPISEKSIFKPPAFEITNKEYDRIDPPFVIENSILTFSKNKLTIFQYRENYAPASAPMTRDRDVPRNVSIDSIYTNEGQLQIEKDKLYFVQQDTTSLSGLSILGVPRFYPRLIGVEDILSPLVYISTKSEFEKLESANNAKKALDKYWLDITGSKGKAVVTIRNYYQRVTNANRYFTTYKQDGKLIKEWFTSCLAHPLGFIKMSGKKGGHLKMRMGNRFNLSSGSLKIFSQLTIML